MMSHPSAEMGEPGVKSLTSHEEDTKGPGKLQGSTNKMQYRRDIDGLRAVAVLPVVIYHIAQSFLRGGYVGVDIFFVISGFLISTHILEEVQRGSFSPLRFYERRIRRIFPASAVMFLVVTALAIRSFYPVELVTYAQLLLAALFSVSNIFLYATVDYFNPIAEQLPLLHTWSLAVEEQFYLIFPPLVIAVTRWAPRRMRVICLGLAVASLAVSIACAFGDAKLAGFYLIFSRAWELLLGTLLALGTVPRCRTQGSAEAIGFTGMAMIALAMVAFTPATPFPGYAALLPAVGAAMVIHSGRDHKTVVARVLSLRPFAFIGLISYSLYLWHWPVMVFQRTDQLFVMTNSKLIERGVVLGASLVLATLSWWLVERTTRDRNRLPTRTLMTGSAIAAAIIAVSAVAVIAYDGLPGRFSPAVVRVAGFLKTDEHAMGIGRCFLSDETPFATFDRTACLPTRPDRPTYMLVGDSHAAALSPGLRAVFPGANVLQLNAAGCLPTTASQKSPSRACEPMMRYALDVLPGERRPDAILLVARTNTVVAEQAVLTTAKDLKARGFNPVLIGPNAEYRSALPRLIARGMTTADPALPDRALAAEPFAQEDRLQAAASRIGVPYISVLKAVCPDRRCPAMAPDGDPMMSDDNHLTASGARMVVSRIRPMIDPIAASRQPER